MILKHNYDYSKLRGRIREKFGNESSFGKAFNLSKTSLSKKLNNAVEFTQTEIDKALKLLDISSEEISTYFFTQKV